MIHGKKIIVVMPAFNAERTLETTYNEIPPGFVDEVILVDDASSDNTALLASKIGIHTIIHPENRGYGANQKTCYKEALKRGGDVVIMLHPDYQYTPKLLVGMASLVGIGQYHVVLGSRMISNGALKGGMPLYKYISNRILTFIQNILMGTKLSEYHTGYRAFSREILLSLPLEENANGYVFDNEMLAQAIFFGYSVGEISCPTKYFAEASSVNLQGSVTYGLGVLRTTLQFLLARFHIKGNRLFSEHGRKLTL
jgi:glycosyltransferase involved in cell wall biosynthesis